MNPPLDGSAPIALIGDLHGHWTQADVDYFNASHYQLLLITGDLGSGTQKNGLEIARSVARLQKPTLVVAGNNDAPFGDQIAAEFRHQTGLVQLLALVPSARATAASGYVALCGYDVRTVAFGARRVSIVVGRPYAMGGNEFSFAEALSRRYGVSTMEESVVRLRQLVAQAPSEELIFLAHNGPSGLGDSARDVWGCDFRPEAGDWGDDDIGDALEYATAVNKKVLAVVAGHMHRDSDGQRAATARRGDVLYVNPALAPRIRHSPEGVRRHHMALHLDPSGARAEDVFVHDVFD